MVRVTHSFNGNFLTRDGAGSAFILTNNAGSFAFFDILPFSKYQGFFTEKNGELIKSIECIESKGSVTDIHNSFYSVARRVGRVSEQFFVPHHYNSLCHESSAKSESKIVLDFRKANDFRQFGRYYNVYEKSGAIVVEFVKKTDRREDPTHDVEEFRAYLAIKADGSHSKAGSWLRRDYAGDRKRNSLSERYVYHAISLCSSKTVFSVSSDEATAISEASYVFSRLAEIQKKQKNYLRSFLSKDFAHAAAEVSLHSLISRKGIYAGLPWFFQHWSRDSMIALSGLEPSLQKKAILSHIRKLGKDGRLENFQGGSLGSSDAVGWLFLRARQLYEKGGFTENEMAELSSALIESLRLQKESYGQGGLIFSGRNESWMDTSFNDNGREGFPIEVQALTLASYDFFFHLTGDKNVRKEQLALEKKVRKEFWNGSYLNDLAGDATIRPNLFLAAYAYPRLLGRAEWERCFDAVLPHLWLKWGGLSSIDFRHPLFQADYTGEDNRSYHRGDSWFWVNNIAAVVMTRLNSNRYKVYVRGIKEASLNDLLWKGAVGCCSELSSASAQKAEGCLSQAWSCSTLMELLRLE